MIVKQTKTVLAVTIVAIVVLCAGAIGPVPTAAADPACVLTDLVGCAVDGENPADAQRIWSLLQSPDYTANIGGDGGSISDYYSMLPTDARSLVTEDLEAAADDAGIVSLDSLAVAAGPLTLLAGAGAYAIWKLTESGVSGSPTVYRKLYFDKMGADGLVQATSLPSGFGLTSAYFIDGASDGTVIPGSDYPSGRMYLEQGGEYLCDTSCGGTGSPEIGMDGIAVNQSTPAQDAAVLNDDEISAVGNISPCTADQFGCYLWFSGVYPAWDQGSALDAMQSSMYQSLAGVAADANEDLGITVTTDEPGGCGVDGGASVTGSVSTGVIKCAYASYPVTNLGAVMSEPSSTDPGGGVGAVITTTSSTSGTYSEGALSAAAGELEQPCLRAMLDQYLGAGYDFEGCSAAGVPDVIPLLPPQDGNVTCDDYITYLATFGYDGTEASCVTLPEPDTSPDVGPSAPVRITFTPPGASTATTIGPVQWKAPGWSDNLPQIGPETPMTIDINPPDAPPVPTGSGGGGGGTLGACTCPPIDFSPITSVSYGTKFPFGVFGWLSTSFAAMTTEGARPVSFSLPLPGGGTQTVDLSSSAWETTYRPIVFPILEFLMTLAAVWFIAFKILGIGGAA